MNYKLIINFFIIFFFFGCEQSLNNKSKKKI